MGYVRYYTMQTIKYKKQSLISYMIENDVEIAKNMFILA